MKELIKVFYRIKQFIWAAYARLSDDDILFINNYLNEYERQLFNKLPAYCKLHSVRVARNALDECLRRDLYDIMLIKACLLHDIGKIDSGFNMFTNSIIVMLEKFCPSIIKKLSGKGIIRVYYKHPEIALNYLEKSDSYIKFLIENHHNYSIKEDEKLIILQRCDSQN